MLKKKSQKILSILTFHRVLEEVDPLFPDEMDVRLFDKRVSFLKKYFNILRLDQALEKIRTDSLPSRAICITFDDGYLDNYSSALPILKKHEIPATFFIATGYLNGTNMWNDNVIEAVRNTSQSWLDIDSYDIGRVSIDGIEKKRKAVNYLLSKLKYLDLNDREKAVKEIGEKCGFIYNKELMMREQHLKALSDHKMELGGHTVTHPILAKLRLSKAREELVNCKSRLEQIVEKPITSFAYPNGRPKMDFTHEHAELCKEVGYEIAVSTNWGAASRDSDRYQLPRISPWDRNTMKFGLRIMKSRLDSHKPLVM